MVTIITWACLSIQGAVGQGVRVLSTEFVKPLMNSNDYYWGWESNSPSNSVRVHAHH